MLYNDTISYSQPGISFQGTLQINVPSISNPILLNDISVYFSNTVDYSNYTTVGIVTVNYVSTGLIVIEANIEQAQAISQSEVINLNTFSGEVSIESL